MTVRSPLAVSALSALLLAGCGSADSASGSGNTPASGSPSATGGTVCAKDAAGERVSPPSGFPTSLPLPPGTILTVAQDRGGNGLVVSGVTDQGFHETLHALQHQLPAAGYWLSAGEVEADDAESDFASADYEGRWAIRELAGCDEDTAVQVVVRKK